MAVTWSIIDNTDILGSNSTTSSAASVPFGTSVVDRHVVLFCTTLAGAGTIQSMTIGGVSATCIGINNSDVPTIAVAKIPAGTSSGTVTATLNSTDQLFIYSIFSISGASDTIYDVYAVGGNNPAVIDAVTNGITFANALAWQNGASTWVNATETVTWRSSTACSIAYYSGITQSNRNISYSGCNGISAVTFAESIDTSITATVNSTLDNSFISSSTTIDISVALLSTLSNTTSASSATISLTGTLSKTLDDVASSGDIDNPIIGNESTILNSTSIISDTSVGIIGIGDNILNDIILSSDSKVDIETTLISNLTDVNITSDSSTLITSTLSIVLEDSELISKIITSGENNSQKFRRFWAIFFGGP